MRREREERERKSKTKDGSRIPCEVTSHLELHITKLIAVHYKNNLLITYKWVFFSTPNFVMRYCVSFFDH